MIHNYFEVDGDIVWFVVTVEIPELIDYLRPFVTPLLADSKDEKAE